MVQIALVSCGTEYSGIQKEIEKAALKFGAEIILPEIDLDYINEAYEKFGFSAQSSSLKLMIARAMSIVEGKCKPDAVFIATCFRCAEGALVRNEVRRFIQNNTRIPVVTYSFTERTKADELFIRMEALATTVTTTRLSELVGLPQKTSLHLLKLQLQRHLKELATNGKMLMV